MALQRIALGDLATQFPIAPASLADALDEHGPDRIVWAWLCDDDSHSFHIHPSDHRTYPPEGAAPSGSNPNP